MIAVAGVGPRAGTTTTTLALSQMWPGPEPALIVEADPAGGRLAEFVDGDPYLGQASLARTLTPDEPVEADRLAEHTQILPAGVAILAAPPMRDTTATLSAVSLLTGAHASWRSTLSATVFADCGAPGPDSDLGVVLAAADACLVVVRADYIDPQRAARRVHTLTRHARRRGIVLIGASAHSDFAAALGLPLLGTVPRARASAEALLHGIASPRRRPRVLPAARVIATAVHHHLRPPTPPDEPRQPPPRPAAHRARHTRHQAPSPTVYRLDLPPSTSPLPRPPRRSEPPGPDPVTVPTAPDLGAPVEDAEHSTEATSVAHIDPRSEPRLDSESAGVPVTAAPPQPATPEIAVRIFGPTRIMWRASGAGESVEIRLPPRSREVLAVLALHPEGVNRARLVDMLWGEQPPERATTALTNSLSRLRTTVASATDGQITGLLIDDRSHCRLSEPALTVDYWKFSAAVAARRRATDDTDQATACRQVADLATAELAPDITGTWVEPLRESARRDALNALSWLATRNAENDPRATLGLLEETAESDPYNETIWQDILRLHARLGEYAALTRTYSLLTRKLAEISETPSQETRQLLDHLRRAER
ncbi:BTAD domain-containing putative transcriptional regulator [Nocardia sp. NPDC058176]|uniref:BTAD domain-containing putative transcriptional regulator n=1 Tax=Nocardia sp. NPDC058176 TaxID=3346368 RepID=UPI0036DAA9E5